MEYETKTLKDYLSLVKRRRAVLLSSIISITLLGVYVANAIPAMYRSSSRFLIEQQDIPQDVVQSTVNTYVDEQIQAVRTRVMSSRNLLELIREHNLYPELASADQMQPAVEEVRANTLLETEVFDVMNPRSGRPMMATISFTLSFDHRNPQTARDVAADLANLYLSENIATRTGQVEETLQFIRSDIERYQNDVQETGAELAEFKANNLGTLPELMTHNLQAIERTQRQIESLDREIRDARSRQLQLSSEMARLGPSQTVYDSEGQPILNPREQLASLQLQKMRLMSVYSPEHPDVVQIQKEIEVLSRAVGIDSSYVATLAAQVQQASVNHAENLERYSPDHPDVARSERTLNNLEDELARARQAVRSGSANPLPEDPYAQQLQRRIDAEEATARTLEARKAELQEEIAKLETRVASSPNVERQYTALLRANEQAVANLNNARAMLDEALKAQKLESQGIGDRFTIIEAAKIPLAPYKPNRLAIILLAFVLSCGMGVVLAMILDAIDDTIKGSRDVLRLIDTPPLAVIPYLETEAESRKRVLANVSLVAMVAGAGVAAYLIGLLVG